MSDIFSEILQNNIFPESEKIKLVDDVIIPMQTNPETAYQFEDSYILFINYKFYGLIDSVQEAYEVSKYEDHRYLFPISDTDCCKEYFKLKASKYQKQINNEYLLEEYSYECKCSFSNYPNENENTLKFESSFLIDTGATNTTFNGINNWDFRYGRFKANNEEEDSRIAEMNSRIGHVIKRKFDTSGDIIIKDMIFLREPIYLKINSSQYIPIYRFTVPYVSFIDKYFKTSEFNQEDFLFVIGMDVLNKCCIISRPNIGIPTMTLRYLTDDKKAVETIVIEKGLILYDKYVEDLDKIETLDLGRISNKSKKEGKKVFEKISFKVLHELSLTPFNLRSLPKEFIYRTKRRLKLLVANEDNEDENNIGYLLEMTDDFDGILYKDDFYMTVIYLSEKNDVVECFDLDEIESLEDKIIERGYRII